jgi:hypothetical protein
MQLQSYKYDIYIKFVMPKLRSGRVSPDSKGYWHITEEFLTEIKVLTHNSSTNEDNDPDSQVRSDKSKSGTS